MLVDTIGPRLTGSPEYKRAADWARETLAKWGLTNARLEAFEFGRGWELEKFTIEMVEPRYMPLLGYPEAWSPSTSGEVVARGRRARRQDAGRSAGDESVAQGRGGPAGRAGRRTSSAPIACSRAAASRTAPAAAPPARRARRQGGRGGGGGGRRAAIRPRRTRADRRPGDPRRRRRRAAQAEPRRCTARVFVAGGTATTRRDQLPKVVLAGEHYNMIARLVAAGHAGEAARQRAGALPRRIRNSYNVLAEMPGTDPALRDEVVMLGAHLDSWHTATGATDNADGSVAVMEAFRILKATGVQPRRTLRVALWGGEGAGPARLARLGAASIWPATPTRPRATSSRCTSTSIRARARSTAGSWRTTPARSRSSTRGWRRSRTSASGATCRRASATPITSASSRAGVPGFNPIQDYVGLRRARAPHQRRHRRAHQGSRI